MKQLLVIAACDNERGIGKEGNIPWKLKSDLAVFKRITACTENGINAVVMGRKTWDSIPSDFRPLFNRINCVITKNEDLELPEGVYRYSSLKEAIDDLNTLDEVDKIFIIGGSQIYQIALNEFDVDIVFLTRIFHDFECDVFFPKIEDKFKLLSFSKEVVEDGIHFQFEDYINRKR